MKGYDHDAAPSAEDTGICKHCGGRILPNMLYLPEEQCVYPANEAELDRELLAARKKALEDAGD